MSSPVDPMHTPGRRLVATASGAMHLIESTAPDGTVTATRITTGPAGHDPKYPLGTLRRDDQTLRVTDVQAPGWGEHGERHRGRAGHVDVPRAA